ncbi:hypothetical protein UCDDA912_g01449 [Diaporthe ampelina]|uniref:Sister chromatid cohesion protein dcc1 n=1 Tax=Diaporthe ampelina TaxID=1214573 RepID=A0A0G2FWP2_9PEZI|nr:hypothetical protein UCDDA912_g01449 [Diaporthe ampelina]
MDKAALVRSGEVYGLSCKLHPSFAVSSKARAQEGGELSRLATMLSSQSVAGIPLNHAPPATTYKLLELPPELLALLESDKPPTLRLEPSPTAGLLKTPDNKTWSLRQKNTSNALILLQASGPGQESAALSTVATLHETVELVPEAESAAAPVVAAKGKWHEKFGKTR